MRADKLGYFLVGLFVIVAITGLVAVLGLLGGAALKACAIPRHTKMSLG